MAAAAPAPAAPAPGPGAEPGRCLRPRAAWRTPEQEPERPLCASGPSMSSDPGGVPVMAGVSQSPGKRV